MALVAGTRLGPYEIVSPLGAGGMGEVYRATDTRLDRTVAIKVLNSSLDATPDLKARFEREARTISQLNHPNICTLHDVGHDNGTDFLVMEFIEGESLSARLKSGPLPPDQLLKIAAEVADALHKAHRAGIVHRDLKPGNIMLTKSGSKLLDFGLAKPRNVRHRFGFFCLGALRGDDDDQPRLASDFGRLDRGHGAVHVARANPWHRRRRSQRHFCFWRTAFRDGHR
jgi:serine/threonine protein kinase